MLRYPAFLIYCVLNILRSNNFLQRSLSTVAPEIRIYEVGPRDGLQNESKFVPTDIKVELISKIVAAGIKNVESASFVSPKWVKQMSDSVDVMKNIQRVPGVNYPVLVPNLKGYETAKQCNVEEMAIFPAGSEGFSQKNLNGSVEEGLRRFKQVADEAVRDGLRVRGYISCVVGCPYDGPIHPKNMAKFGIKTVDSSISGLGGCPYARGASGNLATEDLVYFLYGLGVNTDVDLVKIIEAGRYISNFLGKPTESKVNRVISDRFTNYRDMVKLASCNCS
uniref:hydroxymethylglutaryl-CoA lyase n=1 Tax=Bombyx mori TaxID=7091 RepID=Q2F684_BOMMO|nr:hydroxymethylglutaryl-CoA lyase isoform 2 [Bombyx mori]